jgi:UDP-N-acetylmuramoylalanine--D-glutamate ligase
LSSFQIDLTQTLDCDVAVLLNITPDHLDRYESFEAYAASKRRLLAMSHGTHFEGRDERICMQDAHDIWGVFDWGDGGTPRDATPLGTQKDWPSLQGPHNAENAMAALNACRSLGLTDNQIASGLRTYPGLPHRMERVRELGGVLFVNDSKATNPEAAAPALAAYTRIRWIVGGQAKTKELGATADHLSHVVRAYTIGEAGPMFARLLRERGIDVIESETLENAVKCSARDSLAGETVLLSPACASFDQFANFEARGDAFKRLVGDL